jgi:hypothetical protein
MNLHTFILQRHDHNDKLKACTNKFLYPQKLVKLIHAHKLNSIVLTVTKIYRFRDKFQKYRIYFALSKKIVLQDFKCLSKILAFISIFIVVNNQILFFQHELGYFYDTFEYRYQLFSFILLKAGQSFYS